jgi:alkanesulfonate monooxygenase
MALGSGFDNWALPHGSRGALHDPEEPFDASWDGNSRLVPELEALTFVSARRDFANWPARFAEQPVLHH